MLCSVQTAPLVLLATTKSCLRPLTRRPHADKIIKKSRFVKRVSMKFLSLICSLAVAVYMTGCSASDEKQPEQKPIQIALTQDLLSFDPMLTSDIFSEAVLRCVYTSLFDFDDKLNPRLKLAKEITVVDDFTWRITIHDNVQFHDGSPLTTDDVLFSIERARKGGRTEKLLEMVAGTEKIDDTTFLLRSKEPYADLPNLFAKAETSIVSKKVVEGAGYTFAKPVGAGPFTLLSREENRIIRLQRFENYYLDKAASKQLNFVIIMAEQDRTAAFLNGDVDILFSVSSFDCEKLRLSPNVNLLKSPSTKIEYLSLNTHQKPLDNPKVRQAISYAINRDTITNEVYHGYSAPSASLIPKGVIGHLDGLITYDPKRAKQLLKEAGYEDGFAFTVITINTIRKNTLEYIKLDLAEVGIQLNYNLVTMKEAVDMMMSDRHGGILVGWAYSADPNSVLPLVLGTGSGKTMNSSNYSNPAMDELLRKGRAEADTGKKREIYESVNRMVTTDSPMIILQNPMVLSAALTNVQGIHFNSQGLIQYETLYRK